MPANAQRSALRRRPIRGRRGFTLIEMAFASVVIAVAVIAFMQLSFVCTANTAEARQLTEAAMVGTAMQERLLTCDFDDPESGSGVFGAEPGEAVATFDDVDDYDGRTFNPPVDAMGTVMTDLANFEQAVSVVRVPMNQPSGTATGYTGAYRVTVRVRYRQPGAGFADELYSITFIRVDR